jgi:hypothetical protein
MYKKGLHIVESLIIGDFNMDFLTKKNFNHQTLQAFMNK